jgi:hypothetical protein
MASNLNPYTNGDDNMEQSMSLEEARELAELTDRIVSNITIIEADENDHNLLLQKTSAIVGYLETINEDENDLDLLLQKTSAIAGNLETINESEV